MTVPENIATDTVHRVRPVIDDLRTYILSQRRVGPVQPELEIRLCQNDTTSGVTEKAWLRLLSALDACADWSEKTDIEETVDFFYTVDLNGETVSVRTTRSVGKEGGVHCDHVKKQPVRQTFVSLAGCPSIAGRAKIVFSTEEHIDEGSLPGLTSTTQVRIKHRRSWLWGLWRFDMTKCWQGATYSSATQNRDNNFGTSYECEIELVSPKQYVNSHSNEYIALSLLMKLAGLLPPKCEVQ